MPSEDTNILEFNQYQKSDKTPSINYADLEFLIKKVDGSKNNPEKLSKIKVGGFFLTDAQFLQYGHLMV